AARGGSPTKGPPSPPRWGVPVKSRIEEEFLPALDLATGKPLPTDAEPDVARLTDHPEIDLEPLIRDELVLADPIVHPLPDHRGAPRHPAIRDELVLAEPIAPLHSPECMGLCIECGLPLDEGTHDHPTDDIDPRLEALRSFKPDDTTDCPLGGQNAERHKHV